MIYSFLNFWCRRKFSGNKSQPLPPPPPIKRLWYSYENAYDTRIVTSKIELIITYSDID